MARRKRRKIKLSCLYCEHWFKSKEVLVGIRDCHITKLRINTNSDICKDFLPNEYFFCPKKSMRINIHICKNNLDNKKHGCGNCITGKVIKLIFKGGKCM